METIELFTDGACLGNPGPGGFGVVLVGYAVRGDVGTEASLQRERTVDASARRATPVESSPRREARVESSSRRELWGGFRRTTNNRMEVFAAIAGLRALERPARGVLYSDSRYLVDAIEKGWARAWRARNWMRTRTEPAKNGDLWKELLELLEPHEIRFRWVRGHAGHVENERCDRLANAAARARDLPEDAGYERSSNERASFFDV